MSRLACAALVAASVSALFGSAASGVTFSLAFDQDPGPFDSTVDPPLIGTGTVVFDDSGDGTFDLFALSNLDLAIMLDGATFTEADIMTTSGTTVIISASGNDRILRFGGRGNGPRGGSLDLENALGQILSFGPGPEALGEYVASAAVASEGPDFGGTYLGTATAAVIPLPAALPLLLAGIGALGAARAFADGTPHRIGERLETTPMRA